MSAPGALATKRILITRAAHQAGHLAEALEAKGALVLHLATIEIVPPVSYAALDDALRAIQSFDWLILTSANGAAAFAERTRTLQLPHHRFTHLQVAAIGPATASAARKLGLRVDVIPEDYVAETVVEALKGKVAGRRVLLARAATARDVIPDQLTLQGADVQVAEAYRTILPDDAVRQVRGLFEAGKPLPDAATFTSSSTVNNFFALLRAAEFDLPRGLRAVSIGPITSRTLRGHGWEPAAEARQSDIPSLADACERLFAD